MDLSHLENLCLSPLDLQIKDATTDDIVAQVKKLTGTTTPIEVREGRPVRLTFDVQGSTVGATLGSVGSLAGCKLWLFDDHLLLAPDDQLSAAEKADAETQMGGEWAKDAEAGGSGWSARAKGQHQLLVSMADMFGQQSAKDPAGKAAPTVTHFGNLSPDGQAIMQQLVVWANANARRSAPQFSGVALSSNTKIIYTGAGSNTKYGPGPASIDVSNPADSDANPASTGWSFTP